MSAFSNYAISLSIICILAGGVTSFHLGLCSVGGASIGLGWPLVCLFSLAVAVTMGQLASTFPTAGGLYHWASILGGRGWGWATAWFNLAGPRHRARRDQRGHLPVRAGAFGPALRSLAGRVSTWRPGARRGPHHRVAGGDQPPRHRPHDPADRLQRLLDPAGRRALTAGLLVFAPRVEPARLVTFANYSGAAGGGVWPATDGLACSSPCGPPARVHDHRLRRLGAHRGGDRRRLGERAARHRAIGPRLGRCRLGDAGAPSCWPRPASRTAARQGEGHSSGSSAGAAPARWPSRSTRDRRGAVPLRPGDGDLGLAHGLRLRPRRRPAVLDGRAAGLPARRSPAVAIWAVAAVSVLFTLHTPVYSTITAVCTIFLYLSYVLPTALGAWAYGRTWTAMGPWDLGRWYRPLGGAQRGRLRRADRDRHAAAQRAIGVGRGGVRDRAGRRVVRRRATSLPRPAPCGVTDHLITGRGSMDPAGDIMRPIASDGTVEPRR